MPNLEQDRRFLDSAIPNLSDYLLSKELFYPLDGDLPRLTLGNLLLAELRLRCLGDVTQSLHIEAVREKWRTAWSQKASREIHTRVELWRNFLDEYRSSPGGHADRYPVEVRHREILRLLSTEAQQSQELIQLPQLDSLLKGRFVSGDFVWEKRIEPGFDPVEQWYLFGRLKAR